MNTAVVVFVCMVAGVAAGVVSTVVIGWVSPATLITQVRRGVLVATPVLFGLIGWRFGPDPVVPAYCVLATTLVTLTAIDFSTHRLPREITYPGVVVGAVLLTAAALIDDEPERIWRAAIGAGVALAGMWLIHLVSRGDLGDGDVRLAPLLGMYLGYVSLTAVALGLFAGFALGSAAGMFAAARRGDLRTVIPFGPFLAIGALATILVAAPD